MNTVFCALPLNLDFIEILLHLVNLAILVVAVRFLLYKPIKKFMAKRADEYREHDEQCEQKTRDAENMKKEYEELVSKTKQETLAITESATAAAEARAEQIILDAKQKAQEILSTADEEIRRKMQDEAKRLKLTIADLACSMAEEILKRELSEQDLNAQLNSIIEKWDNA